MDIFALIPVLRQQKRRAALITLVETRGSTPRKPGAHMLICADGTQHGTIGGGKVEHVLKEAATRVLQRSQPEMVEYQLTADLAMCCGGQMRFFVEPIVDQPILIVFGCGHVGAALIQAAAPLGFEIVAVDDLEENANAARIPQASRIVCSYEVDELQDLPFGENTYVVIVTREHAMDQRLLELCLRHETRFLGTIGSPRKARTQRERLVSKGFSEEAADRVRCPVGVDVGAETPEEIAISICAELVSTRRGGPKFAGR